MKPYYSRHTILNHYTKTASSLVLLAVLFFSACTSNKPEELKAIEENNSLPSLELENFETFITDSGRVRYHIVTPLLLNYDKKEDPYTEYPKGGQIITYLEDGKTIESQIKCKYAIHKDKDQLWDLRNNVEAVNVDGVVFNTEQLFWDEKEEKVYTEKFVKITTTDEIITGYGLDATQNMKKYQIKNISGVIGLKE